MANEVNIVSAHRTPDRLYISLPKMRKVKGIKVIIAGAGGAAHLPGMLASITPNSSNRSSHQIIVIRLMAGIRSCLSCRCRLVYLWRPLPLNGGKKCRNSCSPDTWDFRFPKLRKKIASFKEKPLRAGCRKN